jgi:rSAM/selenodomain-associated transferase 1
MKQPSSPSSDTSRLAPHAALVIFAKAPVPGKVKTRLCPPLTPDEAATLHGSFVLDMLERTTVAVAKLQLPFHRYLACAPSSELVFFKIMEERQSVRLLDQIGEDLGQRMHRASVDLFAKGYKQVIIVGADVPTLPLSVYQDALAILGRSDLVLGPALDGGYYLIGLKRPAEQLFTGVPWSTDQVLAATQRRYHCRLTIAHRRMPRRQ